MTKTELRNYVLVLDDGSEDKFTCENNTEAEGYVNEMYYPDDGAMTLFQIYSDGRRVALCTWP